MNKTMNLQFQNARVPATAESYDPAINGNNNNWNHVNTVVAYRNQKLSKWFENKNLFTQTTFNRRMKTRRPTKNY